MAHEMNKQFEHRGYRFNICVQLDTTVERCPDGKRFHTVICNDMGITNYYHKKEVEDANLLMHITFAIEAAKKFVDEREDGVPPLDQRLADLGFV